MGLITERDGTADGFQAVTVPPQPDGAASHTGAILRRKSAFPTRRAVLHLHGDRDSFVPEDLVTWYTERGFQFFVADLRETGESRKVPRRRRHPDHGQRFATLDAACRHLLDAEGIDMILVSAHGDDAITAALWCDARRDAGLAHALILSSLPFRRELRRGVHIACPVLVMAPGADAGNGGGQAARPDTRRRRGRDLATTLLGPHVTWLRLDHGLDKPAASDNDASRQRLFDELGRWLGAYMYGQVRDQLL